MRDMPGYEWLNGPAGAQLGKGDESVPLSLDRAEFELGVIAGNLTVDPITSAVLEDLGMTAASRSRIRGWKAWTTSSSSTESRADDACASTIRLTARFLEEGSFGESESESG